MKYPTKEEVESADKIQLGRWWRFLPSPGKAHVNLPLEEFNKKLLEEFSIQSLITRRFNALGGWGPTTSKLI